jgi:hypothetical protein
MGLFGRKRSQQTLTEERPACMHMALTARWDSIDDMGNEDKAIAFACSSCGAEFTPDEARELRAAQSDTIRKDIGSEG